jgi:hypothetical protein
MADDHDNHDNHEDDVSRRHALECMLWAATGVLWTVSGGVPKSFNLLGQAEAAPAATSFASLQISDSHVGFDKAANPNALGTLQDPAPLPLAVPADKLRSVLGIRTVLWRAQRSLKP